MRKADLSKPSIIEAGNITTIGMIQRSKTRRIISLEEIHHRLENAYPDANVECCVYFEHMSFVDQVRWFSSKDVIIGAHGAVFTNSIWIREHTIVMQIYPPFYYPHYYYDSLIKIAGGVSLSIYHGQHDYNHRSEHRRVDFRVSPNIVLDILNHSMELNYTKNFDTEKKKEINISDVK